MGAASNDDPGESNPPSGTDRSGDADRAGARPVTRRSSWLHLSEDEEIVWQSRPHPIAMGSGAAVGVAVAVFGLAAFLFGAVNGPPVLGWVGLLVAAVGGGFAAVRYVYWTNSRYVITSEELYEKHGVVSRDIVQFRLDRVQNTTLRQSALGRALGYADLTVYTAGTGDPELTFTDVPDPGEASAALSTQLGEVVDANRSSGP